MAANETSWSTFSYPVAYRDELVVDDYHGVKISDPYRWLENPDSEETKSYVDKLNSISKPFIESCPLRKKIQQKLTDIYDHQKYECPRKEGEHYFYFYNTGLQNQSVLYIQDELDGEAKVFFDPNELASDGTVAINEFAFSNDGTLFAYGLSESGSDWITLNFKEIPSGKDLQDKLVRLRYTNISWTHDNKGVFYNRYPKDKFEAVGTCTEKNEFQQLYYHYLGTTQDEDLLCIEFPNNQDYSIEALVTEDGNFLLCKVDNGDPRNLLFYYDLKIGIQDHMKIKPIVDNFEAKFDFVTNDDDIFTFVTDYDAPFFKLIQIDIQNPEKNKWKTLIEESSKCKLERASRVNENLLIVCYIEDVKHVLHIHDFNTGNRISTLPLDIGCVSEFSGKKKFSEIFYKFESFTTLGIIYHCDLATANPKPKVFKTMEMKGIDSDQLQVRQIFYNSKDGTKVPMCLVHKKELDLKGDHPTILFGYGGFGLSVLPYNYFNISYSIFLHYFNGLLAMPNLRGGGEYGKAWHKAGMKENKQNVFDDFIAAAEYLIEKNLTLKERLTIHGVSNGGLLVAVCANQRPDLFGAVINQVGVLDMLRFQNFTCGQSWVGEWGSSDVENEFDYLIKYSPLHNLQTPGYNRCQYPAMLLLTADHDDRVVPLHSLKYMAQLYHTVRNSEKQKNPLMIRIETKAGHGDGKPTNKLIEERVDVFCFLANVFNLRWQDC